MQDSWQNDYGVKMLGREWVGQTIFLTQARRREEKPKMDEQVQAFIATRFDAVISKNSKKKERGKVFDFDRCDEKNEERNHWVTNDRMDEMEEVPGGTDCSWKRATRVAQRRAQTGADTVDRY